MIIVACYCLTGNVSGEMKKDRDVARRGQMQCLLGILILKKAFLFLFLGFARYLMHSFNFQLGVFDKRLIACS